MIPMNKQTWKVFRDFHQPFVSTVPRLLSEPTIFVPDPKAKTEVENTKHPSHLRFPEFAIVVDPTNCLRSQHTSNLINVKMCHSVYLKLKTQFVYTLLTLTTHSRSESNTDFSFKHNISGLECITQKIKGSFHVFARSLSLMTILAMDYFRLASIEFKFTLLQSLFDRIKSLLGFSESVAVNNDIICIPLKFTFRIVFTEPHVKSKMQENVCQ